MGVQPKSWRVFDIPPAMSRTAVEPCRACRNAAAAFNTLAGTEIKRAGSSRPVPCGAAPVVETSSPSDTKRSG
jgi:hypothetical protein